MHVAANGPTLRRYRLTAFNKASINSGNWRCQLRLGWRSLAMFLVLAAVLPSSLYAREPWTLTVAERLEKRFDPVHAAERILAQTRMGPSDRKAPGFVIDGSRNPDLFLPSELMSFLLSHANSGDAVHRHAGRAAYEPVIVTMNWPVTDFWADLEVSAAPHAQLVRENLDSIHDAETSRRICRSKHDALQAMRSRYDRFDEFLYRAVAPRSTFAGEKAMPREWVVWLEEGCQ
ncbi:MAG TPA: hypothetical protein VE010_01550 [Thermoanaerobaculia bacterium]|nr:hypothetical protein [Thermoanaerobaculia bacterium]